jgi:hypothetical protein
VHISIVPIQSFDASEGLEIPNSNSVIKWGWKHKSITNWKLPDFPVVISECVKQWKGWSVHNLAVTSFQFHNNGTKTKEKKKKSLTLMVQSIPKKKENQDHKGSSIEQWGMSTFISHANESISHCNRQHFAGLIEYMHKLKIFQTPHLI